MSRSVALVVLLSVFGAGCGYHTAGHTVTIPDNVRTIAIPAFVNQTQTFKIEQMLTAAVAREFVTRTHYHIVNQVNDDADAVLHGTVLATYSTSPYLRFANWTRRQRDGRGLHESVVGGYQGHRSFTRIPRICFASSTRSRAT